MPTQDTSEIRDKILSLIKNRGPSLPVHIAGEVGLSVLFASAFLSELLSEKRIKISHMKIGNSPLYLIQGQEEMLENFSQYLKSRERDAFLLLKEKKFLEDSKQEPSIRVALRAIRDFAIPFRKPETENLFWRYFMIPISEFKEKPQIKIQQLKTTQKSKELNIFDKKSKEPEKIKVKQTKKPTKRKTFQRKGDRFFNKIKDFLAKKQIQILSIEGIGKNNLNIKVRENNREYLVVAYNKKRINEDDIDKAYKKASEINLPYKILSLGEPFKKIKNLVKAIKKLESLEKIE